MLNRITFCLVLWLISAPSVLLPQTVTFEILLLTSDGFAYFGDEDFNHLPFDVQFRLAALPAGARQLAVIGPLELRYELGAIEGRLTLDDSSESFLSRTVLPGDLIVAKVFEDAWILTVGSSNIAQAGITPGPDPGVFTLGFEPGAEARLLDFAADRGVIFRDGFESGDTAAWSLICASWTQEPRCAEEPGGTTLDAAQDGTLKNS